MKRVALKIPEKLFERAKLHAHEECTRPEVWLIQVLEDHLNLLDKCSPHIAEGKRKEDCRTARK